MKDILYPNTNSSVHTQSKTKDKQRIIKRLFFFKKNNKHKNKNDNKKNPCQQPKPNTFNPKL